MQHPDAPPKPEARSPKSGSPPLKPEARSLKPAQSAQPKWTELAVGTAIVVPGSARQNRTGDWRSSRPIWDHQKCIKCGVCVVFCPEGCIGYKTDGFPEADLTYCKGCAICVRECWTTCIKMAEEEV